MPARVNACDDRVFRTSVFPSRTMISIGTSFAASDPDRRAPATSSIVCPANLPPALKVSPYVLTAALALAGVVVAQWLGAGNRPETAEEALPKPGSAPLVSAFLLSPALVLPVSQGPLDL
jgi:hypothetical protein